MQETNTSRSLAGNFELVWEFYCRAASDSRRRKNGLLLARRVTLGLGIAAALFGAASGQLELSAGGDAESVWAWWGERAAWLAAVAGVAIAVVGREFLGQSKEKAWVTARSLAEAYKSEAFRYAAEAPPYDGADRNAILGDRARKLPGRTTLDHVDDKTYRDRLAERPSPPLSPDDYLKLRVQDQIEDYYEPQAAKNRRLVRRFHGWAFALGLLSGGLGATSALSAATSSLWLGVIASISASMAAFLAAGRYEYLATSYQATADRLKWIVADWRSAGGADPTGAHWHRVVDACEQAISVENSGWMAEWLEPKDAAEADQPEPAGAS